MKDQTERLLVLLPWLVANPNLKPVEIAIHFNISLKQLFDDLALLTFTGPGEYGGELVDIQYDEYGINVVDHQGLDKPIQFTDDQRQLLTLGLISLMESLSLHNQEKARNLIGRLSTDIVSIASPPIDTEGDSLILDLINTCIEGRKVFEFNYQGTYDLSPRNRQISPLNILFLNDNFYVVGFCHGSEALRTFKVSKIKNPSINNDCLFISEKHDESKESNNNISVVCSINLTGNSNAPTLPNFKILESSDSEFICSFDAYNHDFIMRLALMYRDTIRIIQPLGIEEKVKQIVLDFLELS